MAAEEEAPPPPHLWGIFEDYDQAVQHISNRYVLYNGTVKQVLRVDVPGDGGGEAMLRLNDPMREPNAKLVVPISDPGFNFFRFDPLGWINHQTGPVLAELLPIRQTRRGYGDENVAIFGFSRYHESDMLDRPDYVSLLDVLFCDGFDEMLRGEYPGLADVARELCGRTSIAMAVQRGFIVRSDEDGYTWLWRYADKIGMFNDPMTIQLGRRFGYLREELQENPLFNEGVWLK